MTETTAKLAAAECQRNQRALNPHDVNFCARCGHATGNAFYGHYTSACRRTGDPTEHHLCCPESCALVDGRDMDRFAPCHPAPGTYQEWAAEVERARQEKRS